MSIVSYKCPNCGGGLKFSPEKGFRCEYCLSDFTQEQLDEYYAQHFGTSDEQVAEQENEQQSCEAQPQNSEQSGDQSDEALLFRCPSCGAEIITDATTAATSCHYCHNPVVLEERLKGTFKPDRIIPFSVTKEQAVDMFRHHCEDRKYLPKDFYSESQIANLYGVYYPYWVVDSLVDGKLSVIGETDRTRRAGDDMFIDTSVYAVRREGEVSLNDIVNSALKDADDRILKYVLPFDITKALDFSMTYLSGFRAEKRNIERDDLKAQVEKQKKQYAHNLLASNISGYTRTLNESFSAETVSESWEYALLPVWILVYNYNGREYVYGINGQTGKSFGEIPVNKGKLTAASVLIGFAALVFYILVMLYLS